MDEQLAHGLGRADVVQDPSTVGVAATSTSMAAYPCSIERFTADTLFSSVQPAPARCASITGDDAEHATRRMTIGPTVRMKRMYRSSRPKAMEAVMQITPDSSTSPPVHDLVVRRT